MKKIKFASLLLFAPLALLSACGGVSRIEFQTNWYRNTALGDDIAGTSEVLEYEVSVFDAAEHNGLTAEYTNGTFVTRLENRPVKTETETKEGYVLETQFAIDVKFSFGGASTEVLHDEVSSHVEFLSVGESLRPVYSKKTVHNRAPNDLPESLETCYTEYSYSYEISYNDALTSATVTYTDFLPDANGNTAEPTKREVNIGGKSSYLDNEEILFALRGMNFGDVQPVFRTYNFTTGTVLETTLNDTAKEVAEPVSFERNGEAVVSDALPAVELKVGMRGIGQSRVIVFAKKTSDTDNVNRNVPLRMETPILRSLGKMRYKLVKATFSDK